MGKKRKSISLEITVDSDEKAALLKAWFQDMETGNRTSEQAAEKEHENDSSDSSETPNDPSS